MFTLTVMKKLWCTGVGLIDSPIAVEKGDWLDLAPCFLSFLKSYQNTQELPKMEKHIDSSSDTEGSSHGGVL